MVLPLIPLIPVIVLGLALYRTFFKGRGKK